jgi:hypothetical protein
MEQLNVKLDRAIEAS